MSETYRIELTRGELELIRRALGRMPFDQVHPLIGGIAAQIDAIEASRQQAAPPAPIGNED